MGRLLLLVWLAACLPMAKLPPAKPKVSCTGVRVDVQLLLVMVLALNREIELADDTKESWTTELATRLEAEHIKVREHVAHLRSQEPPRSIYVRYYQLVDDFELRIVGPWENVITSLRAQDPDRAAEFIRDIGNAQKYTIRESMLKITEACNDS